MASAIDWFSNKFKGTTPPATHAPEASPVPRPRTPEPSDKAEPPSLSSKEVTQITLSSGPPTRSPSPAKRDVVEQRGAPIKPKIDQIEIPSSWGAGLGAGAVDGAAKKTHNEKEAIRNLLTHIVNGELDPSLPEIKRYLNAGQLDKAIDLLKRLFHYNYFNGLILDEEREFLGSLCFQEEAKLPTDTVERAAGIIDGLISRFQGVIPKALDQTLGILSLYVEEKVLNEKEGWITQLFDKILQRWNGTADSLPIKILRQLRVTREAFTFNSDKGVEKALRDLAPLLATLLKRQQREEDLLQERSEDLERFLKVVGSCIGDGGIDSPEEFRHYLSEIEQIFYHYFRTRAGLVECTCDQAEQFLYEIVRELQGLQGIIKDGEAIAGHVEQIASHLKDAAPDLKAIAEIVEKIVELRSKEGVQGAAKEKEESSLLEQLTLLLPKITDGLLPGLTKLTKTLQPLLPLAQAVVGKESSKEQPEGVPLPTQIAEITKAFPFEQLTGVLSELNNLSTTVTSFIPLATSVMGRPKESPQEGGATTAQQITDISHALPIEALTHLLKGLVKLSKTFIPFIPLATTAMASPQKPLREGELPLLQQMAVTAASIAGPLADIGKTAECVDRIVQSLAPFADHFIKGSPAAENVGNVSQKKSVPTKNLATHSAPFERVHRLCLSLQKAVDDALLKAEKPNLKTLALSADITNAFDALDQLVVGQRLQEEEIDVLCPLMDRLQVMRGKPLDREDLCVLQGFLEPALECLHNRFAPPAKTLAGKILGEIETVFTSAVNSTGKRISEKFFSGCARTLFGVLDIFHEKLGEDAGSVKARQSLETLANTVKRAHSTGEYSDLSAAFKEAKETLDATGLRVNGIQVFGKRPHKEDYSSFLKRQREIEDAEKYLLKPKRLYKETAKNKKDHSAQIDKNKEALTQNISALATLRTIYESSCGLTPPSKNFYYHLIVKASKASGGNQAVAALQLKELFFKKLDEEKTLFFLKRWVAKALFHIVSGFSQKFIGGFVNAIHTEAQRFIDVHKEDHFLDVKEEALDNAVNYISVVNGAYDQYGAKRDIQGKKTIPIGGKDFYIENALVDPKLNRGFDIKKLYDAASDAAVDNFSSELNLSGAWFNAIKNAGVLPSTSTLNFLNIPVKVAAGVLSALPLLVYTLLEHLLLNRFFRWTQKKLVSENQVIKNVLSSSIKGVRDSHGHTHAVTSLLYDKLFTAWEKIKTTKLPGADTKGGVSEVKLSKFKELLQNFFEVLDKDRHSPSRGKLSKHCENPSPFAQLKQMFDDLVTEGVIDGAVAKMAQALAESTEKEDLDAFVVNLLSSLNRPFVSDQEETTSDENQELERNLIKLSDIILNHFIDLSVEERFESGMENQKSQINSLLTSVKTELKSYSTEMMALLKTGSQEKEEFTYSKEISKKINARVKKFENTVQSLFQNEMTLVDGHSKAELQALEKAIEAIAAKISHKISRAILPKEYPALTKWSHRKEGPHPLTLSLKDLNGIATRLTILERFTTEDSQDPSMKEILSQQMPEIKEILVHLRSKTLTTQERKELTLKLTDKKERLLTNLGKFRWAEMDMLLSSIDRAMTHLLAPIDTHLSGTKSAAVIEHNVDRVQARFKALETWIEGIQEVSVNNIELPFAKQFIEIAREQTFSTIKERKDQAVGLMTKKFVLEAGARHMILLPFVKAFAPAIYAEINPNE
jgi:hypothetical protein